MKSKLLMFIATLVAGAGATTSQAQTDVTSQYLINPSFEADGALVSPSSITGWTIPTGMGNLNIEASGVSASGSSTFGISTSSDGNFHFYNRKGWGNLVGTLSQTTNSIPVGTYYLCFDYKSADYSNNNNAAPNGSTLKLTVKQDETELAASPENKVAFSHTNGASAPSGTATSYFNNTNWTQMGLFFTVTTEGAVTITLTESLKNSGRSDMLFDNFRLYSIGDEIQNFDLTGMLINPNGDQIYGWTRDFSSTTDAFQSQENVSFTTATLRFLEVWGKSETATVRPSIGKISQNITGLPNGKYELSLACMIKDQSNGEAAIDNVSLFANGKTVAITENGPTTKTIEFNVGGDGKLDFGIEAESSNANWFCLDNVRLTYISFDLDAAKATLQETINNIVYGKMQESLKTALETAVSEAEAEIANSNSTKASVETASNNLYVALNAAQNSMNAYAALNTAILAGETAAGEYNNAGSATLAAALEAANNTYSAATATTEEVNETLNTLTAATKAMPTYRTLLTTGDTFVDNSVTYEIVGSNLINNNGFENGYTGWTNGAGNELTANAFGHSTTLGVNNSAYITAKLHSGAATEGALKKSWAIEEGKTYLFYWFQKNQNGGQTDWNRVSTGAEGVETTLLLTDNLSYFTGADSWTENRIVFTAGSGASFLNIGFRWLGPDNIFQSFDEFFLAEVVTPGVTVENGAATVSGTVAVEDLNNALVTEITSVHFAEGASVTGEITPANPNTIFYGLPENASISSGVNAEDVTSMFEIHQDYAFNAPTGFNLDHVFYGRIFNENGAISNETTVSGWQSIVLPFDVIRIATIQGNGVIELVPFAGWDEDAKSKGKRPFWLYEVNPDATNASDAYIAAASIQANKTYLISMPNDPNSYGADYNIADNPIAFEGSSVVATSLSAQETKAGYTLTPNFAGRKAGVYALNIVGSAWIAEQTAPSFHGYASTGDGSTPQSLPIFGGDDATSIKEVLSGIATDNNAVLITTDNGVIMDSAKAGKVAVYTANGQLVKVVTVSEGNNFISLPAGQYVINGTVTIVK